MAYVGLHSHIRRNNISSGVMLIMFPLVLLALTFLFFCILSYIMANEQGRPPFSYSIMNTAIPAFLGSAPYILIATAIWFTVAYFTNTAIIRAATSSHSLERMQNKRVYNLVENLCIAQGMSMPRIDVIEDNSLNAFASGINKKTYTVTLSRGIIDKLDDDELESVIAHELSHIKNRDVKLLIISIIFVGIFSFLAQAAFRAIRHSSLGRGKKQGGVIAIVLLVLVLACIGYLVSTLMRFAISRKREYLADAGAVEMTHRPLALASALRKISGDPTIEAVKRSDVAQMFIENPAAKGKTSSMFATHPPITERIRILEQF